MASVIKLLQIAFFLIIISYVEKTFSELYSALTELEKLVKTEQYVIDNIENYINKERKRLYVLKKFSMKYKEEHDKAMEDVKGYLGNPINAYSIIRGQTADLTFVQKKVKEKSGKDFDYLKAYKSLRKKNGKMLKNLTFPTRGDVDGALEALATLQRTYVMNVTEFVSGKLFGYNGTSLTSNDCYKIGELEYKERYFTETIEWMTEALRRYKLERVKKHPFTHVDIMEYISYAYLSLDDFDNALAWNNKLDLKPSNPRYLGRAVLLQKYRDMLAKRELENKQKERRKNIAEENPSNPSIRVLKQDLWNNFTTLCRGDGYLPSEIVKSLRCSYITEHHPFLRLAPLKMEQLFIRPDVFMFHGVMSDYEIDHIKTLAKPLLKPKNLTEVGQRSPQPSFSKLAWFKDEESDVIARVSRRVSDMTGLNMVSGLQVTNYGIGGHDKPKVDYLQNDFTRNGSRKASVIFYMTDVAQGGATVFTELGLRVNPVKGAALFWQGWLPSDGELAARHASCPVLFGSKWVSIKRIEEV